MARDFDVIVLGAGAAGLAAARELAHAGLRLCVLEARSRCGGRIHTLHVRGMALPVELGAEFVHGRQGSVFDVLDAARAAVVELPERHWRFERGTLRATPAFWQRLDGDLDRLRGRRDATVAERLRSSRLGAAQRARIRGFIEGYHAAPVDQVSARWAAGGGGDDRRQFRVLDGYDVLVRSLRERFDGELRLSTVATGVAWRRGHVAVQTRTLSGPPATVRARALLCTLPVGVLQAEPPAGVHFSPELHDKRAALMQLAAGQVCKMVLRFRERFWSGRTFGKGSKALHGEQLHFVHAWGSAVPTWWSELPVLTPVLVAWAGGPAASLLLAMDRTTRLRTVLTALAATLGMQRRSCERQLAGCYEHDWQADPYSRGAYAYVLAGGTGAPAKLAASVASTLFFAGEATDAEQMGTVSGALSSGQRAAREIVRRLR